MPTACREISRNRTIGDRSKHAIIQGLFTSKKASMTNRHLDRDVIGNYLDTRSISLQSLDKLGVQIPFKHCTCSAIGIVNLTMRAIFISRSI